MYRPQIKVLDCTIRDGGLSNNSHFAVETVRGVYQAACASGIDYVELGYRNSKEMFPPSKYGLWRHCDEEHLRQAVEGVDRSSGTKISIMQDAHKALAEDILPKDQSVVDMIRIATYVKDIDKAIHLANNATDKGYQATINIMSISHEGAPFLDEALAQIEEETKVLAVYIVDSFGALYSEEVDFFIETFRKHLKTREIGAHFHNNQQLAYANTIEAIIKGANYLDGTLFGLGRAAGNCPTELLLGFLKNPKFHIEPILEAVSKFIIPLRKDIDWGYHIPYMLSGMLDKHPQQSMDWMASKNRDDYVALYQRLSEDPEG